MLPELQLVISLASSILIFAFVGYYFLSLRKREKRLEKKESEIDSNYHGVIDETLSEERKILNDASLEATQIIRESKYLSESSKNDVDNAIKSVVAQIQKEGENISRAFTTEYTGSLKNLSQTSLSEFQTIMSGLQSDLKKQNKEFQDSLLPQIEKEVEYYKQSRMKEVDNAVTSIVQRASQEIFNKSISLSDHQTLVIQSLEKAKKEGVFDQ